MYEYRERGGGGGESNIVKYINIKLVGFSFLKREREM